MKSWLALEVPSRRNPDLISAVLPLSVTAFSPSMMRAGMSVSAPPTRTGGAGAISNDPDLSSGSLWGLSGNGGPHRNPYGSRAADVWAAGYVGSTATVLGLVDSGIDYTHTDLYLNVWLNPGEIRGLDFYLQLTDVDGDGSITFRDLNDACNRAYVSDLNANNRIDAGDLLRDSRWADGRDTDGNGYIDDLIGWDFAENDNDPFDDSGHGTSVAGPLAAVGGNGVGGAGVSWMTQLAVLKFMGANAAGTTHGAARAIDYFTAATRAYDRDFNRQSRVEYVGTNHSWGGATLSYALQAAAANGARAGNLFVAAAGNTAHNNDQIPFYPPSISTLTDAGFEAVLAVTAIDSRGALPNFANYGPSTVDLGAPGFEIGTLAPGNRYITAHGTSMAAPFVTGTLALLAAAFPDATPEQLRQAVLQGATVTPSLQGRTVTGGRLDVQGALEYLAGQMAAEHHDSSGSEPVGKVLWGTARNDILSGTAANDRLAGVPATGTSAIALGRGRVDTLTGGAGSDVFLLADRRGNYYDDGLRRSPGMRDYALIQDFSLAEGDKLQLRRGSRYSCRTLNGSTEIYVAQGTVADVNDELIARLEGVMLAPDRQVLLPDNLAWTVRV